MIAETAVQRSFRTLRDNSEVKEILFNKSLYQRGKSVSQNLALNICSSFMNSFLSGFRFMVPHESSYGG